MAKRKKKFPDLTKDGKITQADILKGRGVIESELFNFEVMNRVENNQFWAGVDNDSTIHESKLEILDELIEGYHPISEAIAKLEYPLINESEDLLESETTQERIGQISLEELGDIFNDQLEREGYYESLENDEIDQLLSECLANWGTGHGFRTNEGVEEGIDSSLNEEQLNEFLKGLRSKFGLTTSKEDASDRKYRSFKRRARAKNLDRAGIRRGGDLNKGGFVPKKRGQDSQRGRDSQGSEESKPRLKQTGPQTSAQKAGRSYGDGKEADGVKAKIDSKGKPVTYVSAAEKSKRMDRLKAAKLKRQTDQKAGRGFSASEKGTAKVRKGRVSNDMAALARDRKGKQQRGGDKANLRPAAGAAKNKGAFAGRLSAAEKKTARATRKAVAEARLALSERVLNMFKPQR